MQTIEVLIVDPHQLAREGLRLLLAGEAFEVVSATASLATALLEIEAGLRPRLLVLMLRGLRQHLPKCHVATDPNRGAGM
jgi:DNA-binding NarL/FixJ family response regulator